MLYVLHPISAVFPPFDKSERIFIPTENTNEALEVHAGKTQVPLPFKHPKTWGHSVNLNHYIQGKSQCWLVGGGFYCIKKFVWSIWFASNYLCFFTGQIIQKTQAGIVYLKFTVFLNLKKKKLYVYCLPSHSSSCQLQSSSLTVCGITYLKPYKQNNSSSSPDSVK